MPEHHVGELVVAVHDPWDVVQRPVRAQPGGRLVEAGQFAALDPVQERGPPVDLALVEPVRMPEVRQPAGPPVDPRQQTDAPDQRERQPTPRRQIGVERRRPAPVRRHRRPAVDETHQIEGAAKHGRIGAHRDHRRVRHVGAGQRLDDPPLPQDPGVPVGRRGRRRDPHHAVQVAPADLVDLVLAAPGDVPVGQRRPCTQPVSVHPADEPGRVGENRCFNSGQRFPTSCSRYAANFARANASFFGRCSVGHRSSLGW